MHPQEPSESLYPHRHEVSGYQASSLEWIDRLKANLLFDTKMVFPKSIQSRNSEIRGSLAWVGESMPNPGEEQHARTVDMTRHHLLKIQPLPQV